jgi:hypothetical protein
MYQIAQAKKSTLINRNEIMLEKIKSILSLISVSMLTACGGGGGDGGGGGGTAFSSVPLQTAFKNIYANAWTASGAITGTKNIISNSCNGGNGGACNVATSGNFSRATTLNGLTATVNYAQVLEGQGLNTNYTGAFANDYYSIVLNNCSLNLPVTVNIGYVQVATCANAVTVNVTSYTTNQALLTISGLSVGTETYGVSADGSVTPIATKRTGALIPTWTLVSFNVSLNY